MKAAVIILALLLAGCATGPSQQDIAIAQGLVDLHHRCKAGDRFACDDFRDDMEILAILNMSGGGGASPYYPSTIISFSQDRGAGFQFLY
jgi:hypothetical protein